MASINGETRVVAVMGDPIAHSRSPALHNHWIAQAGLNAVYVALRVRGNDIVATLNALPALGFVGANVTLPHKEAAFASATAVSPAAARIGAANTLTVRDDGSLAASNTDAPGFVAALKEAFPMWAAAGQRVCVLGAGGAARAIAVGLYEEGVSAIGIVNRSLPKAQAIVGLLPEGVATATAWSDSATALRGATLVINATSLGLKGKDPLSLDLTEADPRAIIVDTVYDPLETAFLRAAKDQGFVTLDGLGMLIHQAALSFQTWFGIVPDTQSARRFLMDTTP